MTTTAVRIRSSIASTVLTLSLKITLQLQRFMLPELLKLRNVGILMTNLDKAKKLWFELSDVPVTIDGEIDSDFHIFKVGTDVESIWHWFEDAFDISVFEDLMVLA
jgi:hypothetical protein